ncbi:UHRF1-binding protein 1-like [Eumeta japonica]|uniref:UHRF1-binding protein 1-like n=1 Tax=Eumeta variegata TaxID=151549 RepID=A0A4C1VP41_EUMVA|nr:UHRF1-binding protein 1-like [Eumeta japonica]
MVTIIKNQLLKHLSRFTKNLSAEQISLSALRGSGELQDLTLEEDLLTDLLELPGWLRLTSARCNRATFRIQWTKLKTVPIVLVKSVYFQNLDEVHIALEVCSEPRTMNPGAAAAMPMPGKYSYIHKVIDGISVAVNQVQIDFSCEAFTSSVQISRVTVESRTPEGRRGDLRLTRIKSPDTGQLLIFKELEWQSARIEAKARGAATTNLPPLRLLLGNAHCRIVIKKRLSDKARSNNKSYRKVHDAAMAKSQAVWNLCARSPKACEIYLEITVKVGTKAEKEYVKELFIAELRRFKQEDFKSAHPQTSTLKKKQKNESYYMFNDSDSSTTSTDGNSSTCTDLETLQYLRDEDTSLNILNTYPTIKKVFLRYNTCLPSSAPVERLFSYGDCAVIGSRLVFRPEPLAWALTDGQLRAALACAAALAEPVRRATAAATRAKAVRKIEEPREQIQTRSSSGERDILARMFAKHDVRETSYHLLAPRIDLHLCDDPGVGRSEKPSLANGGALQITLVSMQADFFPYHKATNDRRHWRGYREAATPHSQWLSQALSSFCSSLLELLDPRPLTPSHKVSNNTTEQSEETLTNNVNHKPAASGKNASAASSTNSTTSQGSPTRTRILQQLGKLMTTCLVLRIDDFTVYKVSTGSKTREAPRPLVCAEKATLPGDAGLLHAELTHFYYPGDICFPVPPPKLYVQLSPVRVSLDVESVIWLGALLPHVGRALAESASSPGDESHFYMDVRVEAIMPKIVLEAGSEHVSQQKDRPRELQICTARANLTNVRESARTNSAGTRADLASLLSALRRSAPRIGQFPCSEDDINPIKEDFVLHADSLDDIDRGTAVTSEMLWRENRSIWCLRVEPLWADFCGARATNYKPAPLLDATPLTAWICFNETLSRIWVIGRTCGLAGLQLNHYQMLFLMRQLERVSEMASWLTHDANRQPDIDRGFIVIGLVVPAVELTLVLPSVCPGQESSRDLDSVPLDSSSLQDMKMGSESTMAPSHVDSGMTITQGPIEVCTAQLLPADEIPPPSPGSTLNFPSSFTGFSSMRRGLTSLVTSIDSALTRDDSRSDAASTASSDSDRYVVVGLAAESPDDADIAFREFEHGRMANSGVEVAAEVIERSSSPSDHSVTSSCRRRDVISTCTWRLNNIHLVQQSTDGKTVLRFVADDVKTDECSSIPWDEFQSKFSMRARVWSEPPFDDADEFKPRESPRVAAKLTRAELPRPIDDKGAQFGLAPYEELLEARVHDITVTLNMSTALALSEFIEDEVIAPPMPLEVHIENLKLHLIEDRPTRSISSPGPQPLDVDLTSLRLTRDGAGVVRLGPPASTPSTITSPVTPQPTIFSNFDIKDEPRSGGPVMDIVDVILEEQDRHISSYEIADERAGVNHKIVVTHLNKVECTKKPELENAKEKIDELTRENEELKKRLTTLARIAEDNRELRAKVEEAGVLRECVHAAQREVAGLLADKQRLLETVHMLQAQSWRARARPSEHTKRRLLCRRGRLYSNHIFRRR